MEDDTSHVPNIPVPLDKSCLLIEKKFKNLKKQKHYKKRKEWKKEGKKEVKERKGKKERKIGKGCWKTTRPMSRTFWCSWTSLTDEE